jgi:hypothetical protein
MLFAGEFVLVEPRAQPLPGASLAVMTMLVVTSCARAGFAPAAASDGSAGHTEAAADLHIPLPDSQATDRWLELGASASGFGIIGRATSAGFSRLAVGANGELFQAWADAHTGVRQIYLRAWRDQRWQELAGSSHGAGISATTGDSRLGAVDVLPSGQPIVVWFDHGPTRRVMLRYFDGASWSPLGSSDGAQGISGNVNAWWPSLAIDDLGRPSVIWEQYWGSTGLRLRRFEGGAWSAVGSSMTPGISRDDGGQTAQLAAHGEQLHALWRVQASLQLRYRHYDGSRWATTEQPQALPSKALTGGALRLDPNGRPWLAAMESSGELVLLRRDSAGWRLVTRLTPPGQTSAPSQPMLAISTAGTFVACRLDDRLGKNIYVFRLIDDALVPLGSPTPGGVSQSTRSTAGPQLVLHASTLYLSWEQTLQDGSTIYLRRFAL